MEIRDRYVYCTYRCDNERRPMKETLLGYRRDILGLFLLQIAVQIQL